MVVSAPPTDAELVRRVLDGDRHAFADILRRYDDRLRGLAYSMLGGDRDRMDDVLQDAYVQAYRSLAGFRGDAQLGTWLHRIVHNACVDELRRSRRRPAPVDVTAVAADRPTPAPGPDRVVAASDELLRTLATLPDDQRAAVLLVDGSGFDHQTAADIMGVAPGTVASRLWRARHAVRRTLGEEHR